MWNRIALVLEQMIIYHIILTLEIVIHMEMTISYSSQISEE